MPWCSTRLLFFWSSSVQDQSPTLPSPNDEGRARYRPNNVPTTATPRFESLGQGQPCQLIPKLNETAIRHCVCACQSVVSRDTRKSRISFLSQHQTCRALMSSVEPASNTRNQPIRNPARIDTHYPSGVG
ncbi:hypothetical protein B0T16DRAFT_194333 [Cercophora newfieldiana]|uniref:Secreted protein n=1 Tax=Cercophora newfieldiana TaxID=92897 RepID=A0AA40CP57_9PEZI|nr:hypothetical protein B0T16DRAFT_194333 [Cercophora newfieldiana]